VNCPVKDPATLDHLETHRVLASMPTPILRRGGRWTLGEPVGGLPVAVPRTLAGLYRATGDRHMREAIATATATATANDCQTSVIEDLDLDEASGARL
jgi:hypothetical protein